LTQPRRAAILAILMSENDKARADARTDSALADSGFQDPRPVFRERLRLFREDQPAAFTAGLEYYEKTLVPSLASAAADPLLAWIEYGRRLGELSGRGRAVTIGPSGRARPYREELWSDALVLYLPDDTSVAVLPLAIPLELSSPQKATLDLLVQRARGLV